MVNNDVTLFYKNPCACPIYDLFSSSLDYCEEASRCGSYLDRAKLFLTSAIVPMASPGDNAGSANLTNPDDEEVRSKPVPPHEEFKDTVIYAQGVEERLQPNGREGCQLGGQADAMQNCPPMYGAKQAAIATWPKCLGGLWQ